MKWGYWRTGVGVKDHMGDYGYDADAALLRAMRGDLFEMYGTDPQPLMLPLALLVRIPPLIVGQLFGWLDQSDPYAAAGAHLTSTLSYTGDMLATRYLVGAVACYAMAVGAIFSVGAELWRSRRLLLGLSLFALALVAGPLGDDALKWGHPEEMLGAGLLLAGLLCFVGERWTMGAVLITLTFAVKQPFWLVAPAAVLLIPAQYRVRAVLTAVGFTALVSLPWLLPHLSGFLSANTTQVGSSGMEAVPNFNVWGAFGFRDGGPAGRPLILLCALLIPLLACWRARGWHLDTLQGIAVLAVVLLLRAVLDPYNIVYYSLPAAASLLALEWTLWLRGSHPLRRCRALPPLPLLSVIAMTAVSATSMHGGVGAWAEEANLGDVQGQLYVLVNVVVIGTLLPLAFRVKVQLTRSRALIYGAAAAVALSIGSAALVTAAKQGARSQLVDLPGLLNASRGAVLERSAPVQPFWAGEQPLDSGAYLRFQGVRKPTNRTDVMSLFDYGRVNGTRSVSVFTMRTGKTSRTVKQLLSDCQRGKCSPHHRVINTGIGQGVVMENTAEWVIRVPTETGTVAVHSDQPNTKPEELAARLRPLTLADARAEQR